VEIDGLEKAARAEVMDAIAYAKDSPFPDPSEAFTDVYAASGQA
jgi:TPP-dependent pyruvate/acetoin dehydrogenase alpha subunit